MADDYSHLTPDDVTHILKHKPDPEKKLAPELGKDYGVSPRFIRGIWERGGLPTGGAAAKRQKTVDIQTMVEIAKLKGTMPAVDVADKYMVATRVVNQLWSKVK